MDLVVYCMCSVGAFNLAQVTELMQSPLSANILAINSANDTTAAAPSTLSSDRRAPAQQPQFQYASILKGDEKKIAAPFTPAPTAPVTSMNGERPAGKSALLL